MDGYDVVFIGYPIWWGQTPKIVYTFLENYDLSGKTVIPFATSGGSGMGGEDILKAACSKDTKWLPASVSAAVRAPPPSRNGWRA